MNITLKHYFCCSNETNNWIYFGTNFITPEPFSSLLGEKCPENKVKKHAFFTLKSFLRVVRSQFVFLHILLNLCNVFKNYSVAIGGVENFLRAEQVGKSFEDCLGSGA